ncbi:MAG: hypothetical protein II864_11190 [Prevotella sp.]|nr:hypothetical protein [Prevotella sp.]
MACGRHGSTSAICFSSGKTSGDDPKPEPEPEPKPDEGGDDEGGEVTPVTPE